MAQGYFYKDGKMMYGESPDAKSTVIEANQAKEASFVGPQQTKSLDYSSANPAENTRYLDTIQNLNKPKQEIPEVTQEAEKVPGESSEMAGTQAAGNAINTAVSGGSAMDVGAGGLTAAGMYSAQPWLVGAGLGLSALSSIQKGKNQREQNRYLAEVQKYEQRQNAYNKLAQLGQGLKA